MLHCKISNVAATAPKPAVVIDWDGNLHFMQLVAQDNQVYQEWEWEGALGVVGNQEGFCSRAENSPAINEGWH
jgi:hypothetical protein